MRTRHFLSRSQHPDKQSSKQKTKPLSSNIKEKATYLPMLGTVYKQRLNHSLFALIMLLSWVVKHLKTNNRAQNIRGSTAQSWTTYLLFYWNFYTSWARLGIMKLKSNTFGQQFNKLRNIAFKSLIDEISVYKTGTNVHHGYQEFCVSSQYLFKVSFLK